VEYRINNTLIRYEATGEKRRGDDSVLLKKAQDLTTGTTWQKTGFSIEKLFDDENTYQLFQNKTSELIRSCWRKSGLAVHADFPLDQYHTLAKTIETHLAAVEYTKLLSVDDFPLGVSRLEERISTICEAPLIAHNPFDNQTIFHFRVIRPNTIDNNPLHRDVWLEDYDNCINLYIPIAGSDERSSLIIIPESHQWPESRVERTVAGAVINNVRFNVPAVTAIDGAYSIVRPDPKPNEVLVFSPYLIHGGAVNFNPDKTRISIEIRLWKKY